MGSWKERRLGVEESLLETADLRQSCTFSGHPYIGRIARLSLRQHGFLVVINSVIDKVCRLFSGHRKSGEGPGGNGKRNGGGGGGGGREREGEKPG